MTGRVDIQQTEMHKALSVPRERLEAVAAELTQTGIEEWGVEDDTPRFIVVDHQWGKIPTNIFVRRLDAITYHIVFMTRDDLGRAVA